MQTDQPTTPTTHNPTTLGQPSPASLPLSEQVRNALKATGWTGYKLSLATKLPESAMREFLQGKRDLRLKSLDKIAAACGLVFTFGNAESSRPPQA